MPCALLAGALLAGPAAAQVVTPTPYQSPLFHAGSAPTPAADGTALLPLYSQLQGTPTDVVGGVSTQIPSFLLGAYDPMHPPMGINIYYPDHFADGNIYSWSAPFVFTPQAASMVAVDDSQTAPINGSVFAQTGFTTVSGGPAAGTATGGEYQSLAPATNGTATWTLAATAAGSYSLYFHIPDNIADSTGAIETRSNLVQYVITTSGAFAQTQTATASQTEANSSQFLAGPFHLAAGDTVTVTLQRDAAHNQATAADTLVADSVTLQASIGDVQSTPTAINASSFPADFASPNLKYWGIYVAAPTAAGAQTTGSTTAGGDNAPPDTTGGITPNAVKVLRYGIGNATSTQPDGTPVDAQHRIRQLVYFGRSEPTVSSTVRVDDGDGAPSFSTPSGTWNPVRYSVGPPVVNPSAASATNQEYLATAAANGGSSATAQWTLTAPASGDYSLTVHLPATAAGARITDANYHVFVNTVDIALTNGFSISQVAAGDVPLPTGPLALAKGDVVRVVLGNQTANAITAAGASVVADSISLTTGNGRGAIYCVDGFTGAVVWRYQTSAAAAGTSAPVFSSPAVARINVMTSPGDTTATRPVPQAFENKLVVIVGDNNGLVYCLDAIGHGDGTSNSTAIDPNTGQPITLPQPGYGTLGSSPINAAGRPVAVDGASYTPHVGTTNAYWVYRPDATMPKDLATKAPRLDPTDPTHKRILRLPDRDLPAPAAFSTASPTIFVDPAVAAVTQSNAIVYVPNSNGVLYALDALGVSIDASTAAKYAASGDTFNASQDIRRMARVYPQVTTDAVAPTCQPLWWFTLRGGNAALATSASAADFESAPALYVSTVTAPGPPPVTTYTPRVFVGSAHEQESTSNVGRLYALDGRLGPAGNSGKNLVPGTLNYNVDQRPKTNAADALDWSFPDAYGTGKSSNGKARPALGNITGSPVVFTNVRDTTATQTRVYFAANVGLEVPVTAAGATASTVSAPRPDATQTGRVWAVNLDGSAGTTTGTAASTPSGTNTWAYPSAWDPNDATKDTTPEPSTPIGSFLHATPAAGVVQFPAAILNGDATSYAHIDATGNDVKGRTVPMLYVATRGVNDTALYALDIDGKDDSTASTTAGVAGADKLIYRQVSPDGAIFQSSPALVTNSSTATAPGNGGAVYVTAGSTLYDFSATPISNPVSSEAFPLVRENRAFVGFGPLSSPTLSAALTTDLPLVVTTTTTATTLPYPTNATDWVYCGDTSTGFCRGITPYDTTYGGQTNLGGILPADLGGISPVDLSSSLRSYLVSDANAGSTKYTDRLDNGSTALPVYEWGQNVYIRFANVVPPFPVAAGGTAAPPTGGQYYLHDAATALTTATAANPIRVYGNGGPVEFDLSDTTAGDPADHATIPASIVTALPADGFITRSDTDTDNNLVTSETSPRQWVGAYTYAISDGSARRNTPGGQRQVINARQLVHVFTTADGINFLPSPTGETVTLVASTSNGGPKSVIDPATGKYTFDANPIQPVEQPKFGILNPIGLRAGGLPISLNGAAVTQAAEIGDEVGPFRGVAPLLDSADTLALEALANGNDIPVAPPVSTTGGGRKGGAGVGDPTLRAKAAVAGPTTIHHTVVTATGLIPHNGGGDNSDFSTAAPPTGTFGTGNGLSASNFGSPDQPFAADVFDRGALGLVGKSLSLKMYTPNGAGGGLFWNDNTDPANAVTNHDSVVNFLPWETAPATYRIGSANTSPDYPDIASQNLTATLYPRGGGGGDIGSDGVSPTAATGSVLQSRTVYASPLQVHVSIPHYQPPNQQLYDKTTAGSTGYSAAGEIGPQRIGTSGDQVFPMGYVTTKRIYVANANGRYQDGAAFRDIRVYSGVPIDMSTSIANPTTDIGKVPSSFGVQVSQYPGYKDAAGNIGFTPYNAAFYQNYQPVTVNNNGNVNLLNVHFDQLYTPNGPNGTVVSTPLLLTAGALDPLSDIPAFDTLGVTGPASVNNPFLLRSSLDPDMAAAYGINPGIAGDSTLRTIYTNATFHKPRVGGDAPSVLTVPDAPDTSADPAFLVAQTTDPNGKPVIGFKALPHVSVGVPFGTPVGTYSQTVRLFEGMDVNTYRTYNTNSNLYNPLYPPQYGGSIGGIAAPGTPPDAVLYPGVPPDAVLYPGVQPLSTTGTVVKATVLEDRMTDGYTQGALPQIDNSPAVPASGTGATAVPAKSTPDFAPAAFRDPASGNLSLYWTSDRSGPGVYRIYGVNASFTSPAFTAVSGGKSWWNPFALPTLQAGTNSGLTVTPEGSEAFAVNVTTAPYANTLYCYPVTASTGALGAAQQVTFDAGQVKYGVKGVYTGTAFPSGNGGTVPNLWAFWTASTRGRTAVYYNSHTASDTANWAQTTTLLPIPAGLTAVADPDPILLSAPVASGSVTALAPTLEVTYSGTAPDGSVNLYAGRYQPDAKTASTLDPVPFPQTTEILVAQAGGWFQARDVAWSRTGALNLLVGGVPILYSIPASGTPTPLFSRAVFDKASGLLVLTGIPATAKNASGGTVTVFSLISSNATVTAYVDSATGRVRFAGGTPTGQVRATFTPLVRRITVDARADTGVTTFLDATQKTNDAPGLGNVEADRRWYFWRKSAVSTDAHSATLYDKTQRLTVYLPTAIPLTGTPAAPAVKVLLGTTDVSASVDVDYARGRIYFPINAGGVYTEGQPATVTYMDAAGNSQTVSDTVCWQDELRAGDPTATPNGSAEGIARSVDYALPIDTVVNENNVAAFLDPYASATKILGKGEHKVWLFWNSTRNGTADIYSETIDPRFAP